MSGPLLVARDARVAVDGVVRLEAFSLEVPGTRWAVAGDVELARRVVRHLAFVI